MKTLTNSLFAIAAGLGLAAGYAFAWGFFLAITDPEAWRVSTELAITGLSGFCLAIIPAAVAQYLKETRGNHYE